MFKCLTLSMLCTTVFLVGCSPSESASTAKKVEEISVTDPDGRIIVTLTPEQRLHVLEEMNQFLLSTQEIVEGVAANDPQLVQSAVSDGLGRSEGQGQGQEQGQGQGQGLMKGALPPEFRQMGAAMKLELKKIDTLSKDGAENALILDQLSSTLIHCQSCHGSYQIQLAAQP